MDKLQRKQIKDKIESIPLEDIDFTILYTFPFKDPMIRWVYDNSDNFIFQFEFNNDETQKQTILPRTYPHRKQQEYRVIYIR